jgi:dipeptidyl-peptidase-4
VHPLPIIAFTVVLLLPWQGALGQPEPSPVPIRTDLRRLQTVAERSHFKATSTTQDDKAFLASLAAASKLVNVQSLGASGEGKDIPLVILADPPLATPEECAKSGKLLVLCIGNIHAGEVDGKEALLAIMRDIAAEPQAHKDLLKNLVLAVVPNYNPDGNDKMGKDTRPGQVGPEEGQGCRENAAGLDLNRDFVKLEAKETRALLRFIRRWDPAIVIDTHTTNGSYHRYVLTYGGPKNPAGDPSIIEYVNKSLLPGVGARVKDKHGLDTWFYGNFENSHAAWVDYPDQPRFGIPYVGLRNRIGILTESYSYATYAERVRAQEAFIGECLAWAAENSGKISQLLSKADQATIKSGRDPSTADTIAIASQQKAFEHKATVLGYVERTEGSRTLRTDTPMDYEVEHVANFVPAAAVRRPHAYALPPSASNVIEVLQRHGVHVEHLTERADGEVEVYRVTSSQQSEHPFQQHRTRRLSVTARTERRVLEPGTAIVRTAQRLGTLASYLLEPEAADGLATWNFFDEGLTDGADFPAARLIAPRPLATTPWPPLQDDTAAPAEKMTATRRSQAPGEPVPPLRPAGSGLQECPHVEPCINARGGCPLRLPLALRHPFARPCPARGTTPRIPHP